MADGPFTTWHTPHGPLTGRLLETYLGLRQQERVCLVDAQGRVWHYDASEVREAHAHGLWEIHDP